MAFDKQKNLLGAVLFLAVVVGGGGSAGLWTDTLIQVLAIAIGLFSLYRSSESEANIRPLVSIMTVVAIAAVVFQIIPLPASLVEALRPDRLTNLPNPTAAWPVRFLTLDLDRTLSCLTYLVSLLVFFRAVLRLNPVQVVGLLPFFLAGVACNALVGLLQFSLSREVSVEGLLPYTIVAGSFANENHFSTLLFMAIPFLVFLAVYKQRFLLGLLSLFGLLLVLFAAGSRAGVLIGGVIAVVSLMFVGSRSRLLNAFTLVTLLGLSFFAIGAWSQIEAQQLDPEFGRAEFARTTLDGVKENWLTGVGYGTFPRSYGIYERKEMIHSLYVNHAHNDFLEIVFEGGLPAIIALAVFLVALFSQLPQIATEPFKKAAFLSLTFVLIHCLVDYPLRTMAIAMSFSYLGAVVFYGGAWKRSRRQRDREEIMVDRTPLANDEPRIPAISQEA